MPPRLCGYPVFGLCGYKNSGKTTLVCRLVEEFTRRGLAVATVKFAHCDIEVDIDGTDSYRHRAAGARHVAVASPHRWAVFHEIDQPPARPDLPDILPHLGKADLVLVESNKDGDFPKLEVRDVANPAHAERPLLADADERILAIAASGPLTHPRLPVFHRDEVERIADFIATHLELEAS